MDESIDIVRDNVAVRQRKPYYGGKQSGIDTKEVTNLPSVILFYLRG